MIQNIIFDLDGVLFDGCDFHASIFLDVVQKVAPHLGLTREYHDMHLNALSTRKKAEVLNLSKEVAELIYTLKQEATCTALLDYVKRDQKVIDICKALRSNYRLFCVSNSIRVTIETCLTGMGVIEFFSGIISNQDTTEPKPSPEPYLTLFKTYNLDPKECLILEDSPFGIESATKSGGHVLPVRNCDDVTLENIHLWLEQYSKTS